MSYLTAFEQATGKTLQIPVLSTRADFVAAIGDVPWDAESLPAVWRPHTTETIETDKIFRHIWDTHACVRTADGDVSIHIRVRDNGKIIFTNGIPEHYAPAAQELENMAKVFHETTLKHNFRITCMTPHTPPHKHQWIVLNRSWLHSKGTIILDDCSTQKGDYVYFPADLKHRGAENPDNEPRLVVAVY